MKTGKKLIIEEDVKDYEFCNDLWRYIKEFLFYDNELYWQTIIPLRITRFSLDPYQFEGTLLDEANSFYKFMEYRRSCEILEKKGKVGSLIKPLAYKTHKDIALRFIRWTRNRAAENAARDFGRLYYRNSSRAPRKPVTADKWYSNQETLYRQVEAIEANHSK